MVEGEAVYVDPAGNIYVFEKKGSGGKDIWRWERRKDCKARVHVRERVAFRKSTIIPMPQIQRGKKREH